MLKTIEGIVTRRTKYGETSIIVELFSAEFGLRSFIVGGIRKKSKKSSSSVYQVLNIVNAVVYDKDSTKLSRIKELTYSHIYKSIPFDVVKSSIATFIIEVTRKAVRKSDDHGAVYHFTVKALINLDEKQGFHAHFHIHYLIKLAHLLGFRIENNYSEQNPYFDLKEGQFTSSQEDHRYALPLDESQIFSNYLDDPEYQNANKVYRKNILRRLIDYYKYHIEGFGELKSLDVLTTIFD